MMQIIFSVALSATADPFLGGLGDRVIPGNNCWNRPVPTPPTFDSMCGGLPLSKTDAVAAGWVETEGNSCDPLYGVRLRHPARANPTVLFDLREQIAGVQFVVNHTAGFGGSPVGFPLWPGSNVRGPYFHPSNASGDALWYLTAHLSDPSILCDAAAPSRDASSVGDRLWVRTSEAGNEAAHFEPQPLHREGLFQGATARLGWHVGGCITSTDLATFKALGAPPFSSFSEPFQAMGQHYWRKLNPARDATPFSLLYDQNDNLVSFIFIINSVTSIWPSLSGALEPFDFTYEYPKQPLIPFFHIRGQMDPTTMYLNEQDPSKPCGAGATATMHLQFRDSGNVTLDACRFDRTDREVVIDVPFQPPLPPAVQLANLRAAYGQPPLPNTSLAPGAYDLQVGPPRTPSPRSHSTRHMRASHASHAPSVRERPVVPPLADRVRRADGSGAGVGSGGRPATVARPVLPGGLGAQRGPQLVGWAGRGVRACARTRARRRRRGVVLPTARAETGRSAREQSG